MTKSVELNLAANLLEFRNATAFQNGILSFIVNLKSRSEDLEDLKNMFLKLDTSKDGTLSIQEMKKGLEEVFGHIKASEK